MRAPRQVQKQMLFLCFSIEKKTKQAHKMYRSTLNIPNANAMRVFFTQILQSLQHDQIQHPHTLRALNFASHRYPRSLGSCGVRPPGFGVLWPVRLRPGGVDR